MENTHKDVLVIAPHPDDETFGCGGTIRMIADSDIPVDVIFMTRGELGHEEGTSISVEQQQELANQRTREAGAACSQLGIRKVSFLGGNDTKLHEQKYLAAAILAHLQQQIYKRIFCPWKFDAHNDHQATFNLLQMALRNYALPVQLWLYEVWKPLEPNMYVPIDNTMERKIKAMLEYRTQLPQVNYQDGFMGLAAYRSVFCPPSKYAEAFYVCDKSEMIQM